MSQENTATSTRIDSIRVAFLDNIRYLMVLLVLIYHSVAAYATVAPHWIIHDKNFFAADIVRELLDVFMMPLLFFVAGYFSLPSLKKKGAWAFIKDKIKRLMIPWALAVLIVLPLALYDQPVKPVRPFWRYWLRTLSNGLDTQLSFPQWGPHYQNVYWFISLLFAFFAVFTLLHTMMSGWRNRTAALLGQRITHDSSVIMALLLLGILTSAGYFVSLLFVPDTSWFKLSFFLEFQVPRLVLFGGYFAFGIYAQSQGWFADGKPLGSLPLWTIISVALSAAYLVLVQPLLNNPDGTLLLSAGPLLVFAFIRSFLLLSVLIVFCSFGIRYWNHSSGFDRQLAATSYNIYLTHVWFVVPLQLHLMAWTGGSVLAKFAVVFFVALVLSYAFSRWVIGCYPRVLVVAILALFVFCLIVRP
jgi:glucans biosynthesis protein C